MNDSVLYGIDGICQVTRVTTKIIDGNPEEYYVLHPVGQETTTIYVPMANEALVSRMHRLLSVDEVLELIRSIPEEETIWIENDLIRRITYGQILLGDDRRELLRLIKTLFLRAQSLKHGKRKMHAADEKIMKEAEKRLYDEFAHVLQIEPDQVLPFIMNMIGEPEDALQSSRSGAPYKRIEQGRIS